MSLSEEPTVRLEAYASDSGTIYMAAGDIHVHHGDGVHQVRRVEYDDLGEAGSDDCPYPGMHAFGPGQAKWFFGRDGLLAKLTGQLGECLHEGGAVAVVAASGAGKSSLLQAGLVSALARSSLPGSRRWPCLVLTPSAHPVQVLATQLAALTGGEPGAVARELAHDAPSLLARVRRLGRIAVIVDQAEELFTQCSDRDERRRFVDVLDELARVNGSDGPSALVVYGLRADFYARLAQFAPIREALEHRQVFVGPMSEDELRQAVLFPAQVEGLKLEHGLIELLLSDLGLVTAGAAKVEQDGGYEAGRLPLLAHALQITWQQRHGSILTVQGYMDAGRIQGAVADTAERAFNRLANDGRSVAEVIFRRLVRIGDESTSSVRRSVAHHQLVEGVDAGAAEAVLTAFTDRRLLTRRQDTVQITHEVLLTAWPRLREWIGVGRADNLIRQQLEDAAFVWASAGRRDSDHLYRGSRLAAARSWADRTAREGLGSTASDFLDASIRLHRISTIRLRVGVVVLAVAALVAGTSAVIAGNQTTVADRKSREAQAEARRAADHAMVSEAQNVRDSDPQKSLRLSVAMLKLNPTPDALAGLITTLQETRLDGGSMMNALGKDLDTSAFSGDSTMLATAQHEKTEHTITLWDTDDPTQPRQLVTLHGQVNEVRSLSFSPDQRRLVSVAVPESKEAKPDGSDLLLWDLTDRMHPQQVAFRPGGTDLIEDATFSPDGRTLAVVAGGTTGTLTLWDVSGPGTPRQIGSPTAVDQAEAVRFSSDGRLLVTASGGVEFKDSSLTADAITHRSGWQIWDVADLAHPMARTGQRSADGRVLAWSPSGPILAIGYARVVTLWDLSNPAAPRKLGTIDSPSQLATLAFTPDGGSVVVSYQDDGTTSLWDVADLTHPRQVADLTGYRGPAREPKDDLQRYANSTHNGTVQTIRFSRDGQHVLLGTDHGAIARWRVSNRAAPKVAAVLSTKDVALSTARFSPDGRQLMVGGFLGDVYRWDLSDRGHPRLLPPLTGQVGHQVEAVAFNRDGTIAVVGTASGLTAATGELTLWGLSDADHPRRLAFLAMPSGVGSLAFSPTSSMLAVTGGQVPGDTWISLWDTENPGAPSQLSKIDSLAHVINLVNFPILPHTPTEFSPDGRFLALPHSLWDVSKPTAPVRAQVLKGPNAGLYEDTAFSTSSHAAFSPDGKILAGDASDGVSLWTVNKGIETGPETISGIRHDVALSYHPQGHLLAIVQQTGTVLLYDVSDPAVPALAASLRESEVDLADAQFSPDDRSLVVARGDGTAQLWDLGDLPAVVTDPIGLACRIANGGLDTYEWTQYASKGLPYQNTCP